MKIIILAPFFCLLFHLGEAQKIRLPISGITNNYLQLEDIPHLDIQREMIYNPSTEWTYSHHAGITHFKNMFMATWSNGHENEDDPGQRVLYATSKDFFHWTAPRVLAAPGNGEEGIPNILTAAGFHQYGDTLTAYYGEYDKARRHTHLWAKTTVDGDHWSEAQDMHIPVNPNLGPTPTASGRLIIAGNYSFPYTDDPTGLSGWKMSSFYPPDSAMVLEDNPATFRTVARQLKLPPLCEGSFFETDDGILHMLLRVTGKPMIGFLYETSSKDDGLHWSTPVLTSFSNKDSKFNFGRLPDGRFYAVGNPDTASTANRNPLVLSISKDGKNFDQTYIIAHQVYQIKKKGRSKGGQYGYPTSLVYKDKMYVIISREKEAVEVIRFNWKGL